MVLRDIAIHAEHEEPAALLAVISERERLAEPQVACSECLEGTLNRRCRSDGVEHALHRRIDRARETISGGEIEQVDRSAAARSITEDAVLGFSRQDLASSHR